MRSREREFSTGQRKERGSGEKISPLVSDSFNASCRNTGCTERNLWPVVVMVVVVWHRQTQYPRAFTCAYKQRGGNYTYGNAGCRTRRGVGKEMEKVEAKAEEEEKEDSAWEGPVAAPPSLTNTR